ncbi:MAG: hypothetical protein KDJ54_08140 [Candidatus Competibacteraceae bacterium]|nr:hypothetical protein [Candidatus Competibacteraceae bacterium]
MLVPLTGQAEPPSGRLLAPLTGQAEPPSGRLLASQCAQCHGTNGQAVGDIDRLAGEGFQELWEEMLEMKYSRDTGDIMHRQAKGYTDDQIRLIAEYYDGVSGGGTRDEGTAQRDGHEEGDGRKDERKEHEDDD